MKSLKIFDFDDTLAHSEIPIYVKMRNGKTISLTPHQFAKHNLKPGDFYDFSEFNKLIKSATPIKRNVDLLKKAIANPQNQVTILTARALAYPVKYWLKTMAGVEVYVVAVGGPDPRLKSNYIEKKIKSGYTDIYFIDDSIKNVNAINQLKTKYPDVNIETELAEKEPITNMNTADALKEAIKKMVKEELMNYNDPMYWNDEEDFSDEMDYDYNAYYDDLDSDEDEDDEYEVEDDHEGSMAKSDLASLSQLAAEINDMIDSDDELEGWVQAKITKAADYIESVHKYMKYDY